MREVCTILKKSKGILIGLLILIAVIIVVGLNTNLKITHYIQRDSRIKDEIKIAFIADLHSCDYGENQKKLLSEIHKEKPDLILLGGDIIDDKLSQKKAKEFFTGIQGKYKSYYVTGNHEFWTKDINQIKELVKSFGTTVLEGDTRFFTKGDTTVTVGGIDDKEAGLSNYKKQLEKAASTLDKEVFSILLSHRPEDFELYSSYPFDLVFSGHAHGGQWRIPHLLKGVYAPNQGFFPKYTEGEYSGHGTKMIVSRGLSRESTRVPRFFNPPELVIMTLKDVK